MPINLHHKRPTIGFLTSSVWDDYATPLWHGVIDAAQALEVNLIVFPGSDLGSPEANGQENIVYEIAGTDNVDGLVVSGGVMSSFIGVEA